jgi:hypothetical protein
MLMVRKMFEDIRQVVQVRDAGIIAWASRREVPDKMN